MKLYRISLDEAISWLEMFISSTVLLDDQIRTSFGHESSHFEVLLAKYEFKRNRLDESVGRGEMLLTMYLMTSLMMYPITSSNR
jgi:hypothetical protein